MVFDKIRDLLIKQLDVDPTLITMDTNIVEDLGADSLDLVELIMTVEEEFNIVITDDNVEQFVSVRQIVDYIDGLI
jgi:acyl carrier protein